MPRPLPKVTAAQLSRMTQFLKENGARVAAMTAQPDGSYKVVTMEGAYLITPDSQGEVDTWADLRTQ